MRDRLVAELNEWRADMLKLGCATTPVMEAAFIRGIVSACAVLSDHPDSAELAVLAAAKSVRISRV